MLEYSSRVSKGHCAEQMEASIPKYMAEPSECRTVSLAGIGEVWGLRVTSVVDVG